MSSHELPWAPMSSHEFPWAPMSWLFSGNILSCLALCLGKLILAWISELYWLLPSIGYDNGYIDTRLREEIMEVRVSIPAALLLYAIPRVQFSPPRTELLPGSILCDICSSWSPILHQPPNSILRHQDCKDFAQLLIYKCPKFLVYFLNFWPHITRWHSIGKNILSFR
jgi:hypothetical protein